MWPHFYQCCLAMIGISATSFVFLSAGSFLCDLCCLGLMCDFCCRDVREISAAWILCVSFVAGSWVCGFRCSEFCCVISLLGVVCV